MLTRLSPKERARLIGYGALLAAGAAATLSWGLSGLWLGVLVSLGFTALALFAEIRSWHQGLAGFTFAGFALLGGGGLVLGLSIPLGLITVAAALVAWDLHHFTQRLAQVARVEAENELVAGHLQRLFVVTGLGSAGAGLSLLVRINYGVGVLMLLGLFLVLGLSRVIRYLRRESD